MHECCPLLLLLLLLRVFDMVQLLKHRPLEISDLGTPGELASSKPTVAALHEEFGRDFSKLRDEEHLVRALEIAAWDATTTLAYTFAVLNTLCMYAPALVVRILTGVAEGDLSISNNVVRVERCKRTFEHCGFQACYCCWWLLALLTIMLTVLLLSIM